MTITLKKAFTIYLATALVPSAIALGQQGQSGDAGGKSQPATLPAQSPLTPDRLFALVSTAVVKLTIKDEDDREIGTASGFIVRFEKGENDKQGRALYKSTIITNYHVIRPAISIDVSFSDGHTGWASEVIAEDESADLAVLLASSLVKPKQALKLQESANPPIGTKVYAIGSPQGLSNTLSEGIISGYRQRGKHEPWIQITAPISSGSSGGPLLSPEGLVIGVTTAFLGEGQNLNFAVPVSEVSRLLAHIEKPRPIWEGASPRKTEKAAFQLAEISFLGRFRQPSRDESPDGQSEQTFEQFRKEQLSAGDQLALLLKGRELYFDQLPLLLKSREPHFAGAISMLRRATKADSGEYAYLAHYGLALAIWERAVMVSKRVAELERVVQPLKRAKELNPGFGPTFFWLSEAYYRLEMYPEALVEVESLVRLMPRFYKGYRLRGQIWAELGREEAFESDFEMAFDLLPNDRDLLLAKGGGYVALDKLQKAVDTYKDALKLDESYLITLFSLGNALQKMGNYDEAIKVYQRGLKDGWTDVLGIEDRIAECRRQMMQSP